MIFYKSHACGMFTVFSVTPEAGFGYCPTHIGHKLVASLEYHFARQSMFLENVVGIILKTIWKSSNHL